MPSKAKRIKVFLSSPSNLASDREPVKKVVSEINIDTGSKLGYFIDLITWETHTHPAAGAHPQEVINQQIPNDIDIFIGLMGHYFGTKTEKWGSGTEEEFRIAHASLLKNGSPKIMFYFSTFVTSTREIKATQLAMVESFKAEIGELGFLYGTYDENFEFAFQLRRQLGECILTVLDEQDETEKNLEEHSFETHTVSDHPFFGLFRVLCGWVGSLSREELPRCCVVG